MTDDALPYVPLTMLRAHLNDLPVAACPPGTSLRLFRRGDEHLWASIETLAGEFATEDEGRAAFEREFGAHRDAMEERCFFLQDDGGKGIGTATAWWGHLAGEERGRVHWVGVVPPRQGQGLSRPLLSAVLARLAIDHRSAYLTTQTTSYRAVNLYLSMGFVPYVTEPTCRGGWQLMERILQRTLL